MATLFSSHYELNSDRFRLSWQIGEPEPFMIKPRQRAPALVVWIEGLGAVGVTEHAVERLCQNEPGINFPLRSLMRQLAHPGLVEVELPSVVLKHKMSDCSPP